MKNKKTKKNLKDLFAFGGTAMNIDSPSKDLEEIKKITENAMIGSAYDPMVMGLKGLGSSLTSTGFGMAMQGMNQIGGLDGFLGQAGEKITGKPFINKILPGAQVTKAALGGIMGQNIEAEGKEMIETPDGQVAELKGPSHENGGIDMTVPGGTEVYSKRIKGEDGKTMANRKKTREKELARISKLLEKNPQDKALKRTLEKIKSNNDILDKKDLSQMEFIKNMLEGPSQPQGEKFALGGYADGKPVPNLLQIPEIFFDPTKKGFNRNGVFYPNALAGLTSTKDYISNTAEESINGIPPMVKFDAPPAYTEGNPITTPTTDTANGGNFISNLLGGMTGGDMLGIAGNLFGAFGGLQNTLNQKNATNPEVNHFENYGQKALETIKGQYGLIDDVRDSQLQDIELSRQGTINRNNNSARSVNTQRALNLATDSQADNTRSQVYNQFAQQMMGIMGQQAGQENTMDQARMTGEAQRADNEVKNQDSFYSNLARNIASVGAGIAMTGKSMNDMKERDTMMKIVENANPNFYIDSTGVIRSRSTNAVVTLAQVKAYEGKSKENKEDKE